MLDGVYLGRKAPLQTAHGAWQVAAFFLSSMSLFFSRHFCFFFTSSILLNPTGLKTHLCSADEISIKAKATPGAVFTKDMWMGFKHDEEFGSRAT